MSRGELAIRMSRKFDNMLDAAGWFDFVINDLGFASSALLDTDGVYFVLACDKGPCQC